jgi:hypothetical protein
MNWINVNDALPNQGVPVLVTDGEDAVVAKYFRVMHGRTHYWEIIQGEDGYPFKRAAFWMPLPALPNELLSDAAKGPRQPL